MDGLDDAAVRQAILETEPEVTINQTALSAPSRDDATWLTGVVDEIMRRGWLSGARLLAVRRGDVPGGGDLAAILRYAT
jgi:hypothetical protein